MTLATKLTLALWAGILVVHSLAAGFRVHRERSLFEREIARDEQVLGRALSHAADRAFRTGNEQEALALLQHATEREDSMRIRWLWLSETSAFEIAPPIVQQLMSWPPGKKGSITTQGVVGGEEALITYVPMETPGGKRGALEIADVLREEKQYIRDSVAVAVATSMVLAGLCALLAWALLSRLVKEPLQALIAYAQRIGGGDFMQRVPVRSGDEMGLFSAEMNKMCDRLEESRRQAEADARAREEATEQLRHADRLKTVGTLASGIAHELGTPINVVEGHVQLAREAVNPQEVTAHLDVIGRQCRRMTVIIRQLLDFSRQGGADGQVSDLGQVVREAVAMVEPMARKSQVVIETGSVQTPVRSRISSGHLQQVVLNLLVNSLQAMPEGGQIKLKVSQQSATNPDTQKTSLHGFIEVQDSGIGMDDDTLERAFEPFFTTKDVGEGTGLGLSVAYGIVRDFGGWLDVESQPGLGSRFRVFLPLESQDDERTLADRR